MPSLPSRKNGSCSRDFHTAPCDEITAEELARRAQSGSFAAFAELIDRYEGRLFNFILRRTGNWSDAEELTQEAFVRAWERIERYDDQWRFSTWLFTIGSRLAVSHHRAQRRVIVSDHLENRPSGDDDPASAAIDRERGTPTWDLAARILTEAQHTALWLRYAEGLSMKEIARVMRKSQVSVRVTLFRARDQLATHILKMQADRAAGRSDLPESSMPACAACLDTWVGGVA